MLICEHILTRRLSVCLSAHPSLSTRRMRWSALRSSTLFWALKEARRRSTCCVTCTTPLQTRGCASSRTPTATGSACTSANTCRHEWRRALLKYFMMKCCIYVQLQWVLVCFQREMASTPVRYVHFDIPLDEAYSLDSVGKHGFGETVKKLKSSSFTRPFFLQTTDLFGFTHTDRNEWRTCRFCYFLRICSALSADVI